MWLVAIKTKQLCHTGLCFFRQKTTGLLTYGLEMGLLVGGGIV